MNTTQKFLIIFMLGLLLVNLAIYELSTNGVAHCRQKFINNGEKAKFTAKISFTSFLNKIFLASRKGKKRSFQIKVGCFFSVLLSAIYLSQFQNLR